MKVRILYGTLLAGILLLSLIAGGHILLTALTLLSVAAVYEMRGLVPTISKAISLPAFVFAATYAWVYSFFGMVALVCLYVICILATMTLAVVCSDVALEGVLFSLFVFLYPLAMLVCMLLIYFAFPRSVSLTAACLAFCTPQVCDTFAYFGGSLFGSRKLCPSISPNKTVEGSISAVLGGVVFGAAMIGIQCSWGGDTASVLLLLTGLLCGVFSQIGDLFASRLKRWAKLKDFSNLIPGHGGVLDRIDSILVCAPVILIIFLLISPLRTL